MKLQQVECEENSGISDNLMTLMRSNDIDRNEENSAICKKNMCKL